MPINRDCLFCASRFTASLDRRLFCSDICRARYNRENRLRCFYCGELATSRDHVFPHSARTASHNRTFEGQETVNACSDCNSTLSDAEPFDLIARTRLLAERIEFRFGLDKPMPEWSDDELNELGFTLRSAVAGKIRARQRAMERVIHARGVWRKLVLTSE